MMLMVCEVCVIKMMSVIGVVPIGIMGMRYYLLL